MPGNNKSGNDRSLRPSHSLNSSRYMNGFQNSQNQDDLGFFVPENSNLSPFGNFPNFLGSASSLSRRHGGFLGDFEEDLMPSFHNMLMPTSPFSSSMMGMNAFEDFGNPTGSHYSSVTMMSTTINQDGKPVVEKYAKVSKGDSSRKVHEVKEAYSSSKTGMDKISVKREINGRGRHVTQEKDQRKGETVIYDDILGMEDDEEQLKQFDSEWEQASSYLPKFRTPSFSNNSNRLQNNRQFAQLPNSRYDCDSIDYQKSQLKNHYKK